MARYDDETALIVVDMQNDFADPGGSLYVPGGDKIVTVVNQEIESAREAGAFVVYTQDWHPESTPHFAGEGGIWPVHCVGGTWGAELHPDLDVAGPTVRKGIGGEDGYSGFSVRDPQSGEESATGLADSLAERGVTRVVVVGLALDYCVKATALDAAAGGWETTVVEAATRAVNLEPEDGARSLEELRSVGVTIVGEPADRPALDEGEGGADERPGLAGTPPLGERPDAAEPEEAEEPQEAAEPGEAAEWDEPEPIRLEEEPEPEIDFPDTDLIFGIPDGPPPSEPTGPICVGDETAHHSVELFYGTDRRRGFTGDEWHHGRKPEGEAYGPERGELELGTCTVSIPFGHEEGELESPGLFEKEDPTEHVVLLKIHRRERQVFLDLLETRVGASAEKAALVFVHGYNVSFEDAARRTAQIAFDLDFDGAPLMYSWPSRADLEDYTVDEANNRWTVPHLQEFLRLVALETGAEKVHLIAHSMGNRAVTEVLRRFAVEMPAGAAPRFNQIALVAPDVDADVFREEIAPAVRELGRVTLYASSRDKALDLSHVAHGHQRAGDLSPEVVLADGVATIDASDVDTSLLRAISLGHSYFADEPTVLSDLRELLGGVEPARRGWLESAGGGEYWKVLPVPPARPVGNDVRPPKKILAPQPRYTETARKAGVRGEVTMQAIIDKQGCVFNVRVLKGLANGLDEEAVKAVETWRFEPATLHGKPVAVRFDLTVGFAEGEDEPA